MERKLLVWVRSWVSRSRCESQSWKDSWSPSHLQVQWFSRKTRRNSEKWLYSWFQFITAEECWEQISKGPKCTGQSPGEMQYKLLLHSRPRCLLQWSPPGRDSVPPSNSVWHRCETLPIRKAHASLGCPWFIPGVSRRPEHFWPALVALSAALAEVKLLVKSTKHPPSVTWLGQTVLSQDPQRDILLVG